MTGWSATSRALSTRGAGSGASGSLPANSRFVALAPGRRGPPGGLTRPGRSLGSLGGLGSLPGSGNRPVPDHRGTLDPGLGRPGGRGLGPRGLAIMAASHNGRRAGALGPGRPSGQGFRIVQAVLDESASRRGAIDLTRGGMPRVTELLYLERDTDLPLPESVSLDPLSESEAIPPRLIWCPFERGSRDRVSRPVAGNLHFQPGHARARGSPFARRHHRGPSRHGPVRP